MSSEKLNELLSKGCPFTGTGRLRPELPPLTPRLQKLPVDDRGYPVPWFVGWINGKPEFQLADAAKLMLARAQKLCWVCGEKLAGERKAFVIGPMCVVNRTTSEPPSHLECAEWSVKGCPFLARPNMIRRPNENVDKYGADPAGMHIDRNPGATCVWETKVWKWFSDGSQRGRLIRIGDPESVSWWREGRPATRAEVMHSIETGLPNLKAACFHADDLLDLSKSVQRAMDFLPKE